MRAYFLPANDQKRLAWLRNFGAKLPEYAALLGLDAAQVAAVAADLAFLTYVLTYHNLQRRHMQGVTAFKKRALEGEEGIMVFPEMGTPGPPPATVPAGILPRLRTLVRQIKAAPNYTDAVGAVLGVLGPEQDFNPAEGRPVLRLRLFAGGVEVRWKRGLFHGLRVEGQRTDGSWELLGIATRPRFRDPRPLPSGGASELRRYRAIYVHADEVVGTWSDIAEVAVAGE